MIASAPARGFAAKECRQPSSCMEKRLPEARARVTVRLFHASASAIGFRQLLGTDGHGMKHSFSAGLCNVV